MQKTGASTTKKEVVSAALAKQVEEAEAELRRRNRRIEREHNADLADAARDFLGLRDADVDALHAAYDAIDYKGKGYVRLRDFFAHIKYVPCYVC